MIGPKTIESMKSLAAEKIDTYAEKMNESFLKSDDGKLRVTLAFELSMSEKPDSVDLDCTISFTSEKIKDKTSTTITEAQAELPLADKVYRLGK
ncbi:MAG TPA: hypothetical protein PLT63_03625 [Syntrophales bacterium]|nr:hypothetical protein [Syntrophales bacterium]